MTLWWAFWRKATSMWIWMKAFSDYRVTHLKVTVSAYNHLLSYATTVSEMSLNVFVLLFAVVEYRLNRSEDAFQELNKKSASLKRILSRIPDEISDRKTFLETIKYVSHQILFLSIPRVRHMFYSNRLHNFYLQRDCKCHQKAAWCRERSGWFYTWDVRETVGWTAKEGICQIFKEIQYNTERILQRRTVSESIPRQYFIILAYLIASILMNF